MAHGGMTDFNIYHGYPEALVRGMRCSFLSDADYHHLTQCESLDDIKLNLAESDYAAAVADSDNLTPSGFQGVAVQKVSVCGVCVCVLFKEREMDDF